MSNRDPGQRHSGAAPPVLSSAFQSVASRDRNAAQTAYSAAFRPLYTGHRGGRRLTIGIPMRLERGMDES
jgi:hypothetical protein